MRDFRACGNGEVHYLLPSDNVFRRANAKLREFVLRNSCRSPYTMLIPFRDVSFAISAHCISNLLSQCNVRSSPFSQACLHQNQYIPLAQCSVVVGVASCLCTTAWLSANLAAMSPFSNPRLELRHLIHRPGQTVVPKRSRALIAKMTPDAMVELRADHSQPRFQLLAIKIVVVRIE